ncbi:MAG: hypothetical protein V3R99_10290 [Thermoguttaceae bacterium]
MNFFAHALPFLDDPYFAVGTGVPDWLSVVDRRLRVRSRHAEPFLDDPDPNIAALAGGILQHIRDDNRFHRSRAFTELSLQLTVMARDALAGETSFRPSFLGHLLLELLVDASLIAQWPDRLDVYYELLESVDVQEVAEAVGRMASRSAAKLGPLISGFRRERILWDYLEDAKLLVRLNQVMRRVRLDPLPDAFREILPEARRLVSDRVEDLISRIPVEPEKSNNAKA